MLADLSSILTFHTEAEARHAEREAVLAQQEAKARETLDKILAERAQWEAEREALRVAGQIYRRMGDAAPTAEQIVDGSESQTTPAFVGALAGEGLVGRAPLKARIGPQRYLILSEMRTWDSPLTIEDLATLTNFTVKRVKDQMKADAAVNVVSEADTGRYVLTAIGSELLKRFETYKAKRGEPLPSHGDVSPDGPQEDIDEEEADTHDVA